MGNTLFRKMGGRRSTPRKQVDERNFPVRVRFKAGGAASGIRINDLHNWLQKEIGSGNYGVHSSTYYERDAFAIHLRTTVAADLLVAAFPDFELADWTTDGRQ